ncbi:MAG: beta-aspartyl-peptidase (threonine type) [Patiriisocius sp.]|jgi:beta-aspartyl-peptidase (threonine type)
MALRVSHPVSKLILGSLLVGFFGLTKHPVVQMRSFKNPSNTLVLLTALFVCIFTASAANADILSSDKAQPKVAIAIHGGAGTILRSEMTAENEAAYIAILTLAIKKGHQQLLLGKDGTQAVTAAIMIMEDSPLFNAGKGAVYTYDGIHELDASIMHGKQNQAGAVAGIRTIKNPILSALLVMQKSEHVMLTATGAESFSTMHGLETVPNSYFNTQRRFDSLQKAKQRIDASISEVQRPTVIQDLIQYQDHKFGTVGAVVLDAMGNLVAGTSTGGMTAKRYGRVGDSPIIGAGTYANNQSCAVSATGHGEYFIRYNVASDICARVLYQGISVLKAANTVMFDVLNAEAGSGGVIAIDNKGNIAMPFNTPGMYRASIDTQGNLTVSIYKD